MRAALIVVAAAAAIGGGLVGAGACSGNGPAPASQSAPSRPAPPTVHYGRVTGYIDPCAGIDIALPYAAGTVTALGGRVTLKPADGNGGYLRVLPTAVAARQHVAQNQKFSFDLPPGRYVLVGRYDRGDFTTFLEVSIAAGRVLHRDLPDLCK